MAHYLALSHNKQVEHAAAQGKIDLVTALLKAGATGVPGPRGCRGRTLLDAAAEGGNERVVSAILKAGAAPDLSVRSGSKRRYICQEVEKIGIPLGGSESA